MDPKENAAVNPEENAAMLPPQNPEENAAMVPHQDPGESVMVYQRCSDSDKMTLYLEKVDLVYHDGHTDDIEGVVAIDPGYAGNRQVTVCASATFIHDDHNVESMGLPTESLLRMVKYEIYPASESSETLSPLQRRLINKLSEDNKIVYPFRIELPETFPNATLLTPGKKKLDSDNPFGIVEEVRASIIEDKEKLREFDSVAIQIRKMQYAPSILPGRPRIDSKRRFCFLRRPIDLELSLDKPLYHHGETITVFVHIKNHCNSTIKSISVIAKQIIEIHLLADTTYKFELASTITPDDFKVGPGGTVNMTFHLKPDLSENLDKCALAVDSQITNVNTNLASSTILPEGVSNDVKRNFGIIVRYIVRVLVTPTSHLDSNIKSDLSFLLMHPKPEVPRVPSTVDPPENNDKPQDENNDKPQDENKDKPQDENKDKPQDENLIKLENEDNGGHDDDDDDLVFGDFARERLKEHSRV